MGTPEKNLSKEEKENVLLVLNEFSEEYKANTRSVISLATSIKEYMSKIDELTDRVDKQSSGLGFEEASQLKRAIEVGVERIIDAVNGISIPEKKLRELAVMLDTTILFLKSPIPQKVIHQHHVPKLVWITAGLFIILALVCSGWYVTGSKLNSYIANDIKYRLLKLDTGNLVLQHQIHRADSLFVVVPRLNDSVIFKEEEYRKNFELLQKARRMKVEADQLNREAKKLKDKVGER
jgi:hypothetical protein